MKCKCGNEIKIQMGSNIASKGCKILTAVTMIVTAQCEKCKAIFQIPISSNNGIIVKKDS